MLNYLWAAMILIGIVIAALEGNMQAVCEGVIASSKEAVELLFVMTGVVCMWNGMLYIAKNAGMIDALTRKMRPFLKLLFPNLPLEHKATTYIASNFIANILGLGWACTPTGIQAMKELKKLEMERGRDETVASDEMCTFLIMNISSLQLVSINMIAYRTQYGSVSPIAVVGPSLVATLITTFVAFFICKIICTGSGSKKRARSENR
ncbi:MAG: nucleoside recognition protein [Lachnospiraceae bacterium]|nr:nucleoside recognition protein [Lachnospiraceae bacterium]